MRYMNPFDGLLSLWESELDNAELDERRELVRAERSSQSFIQVLIAQTSLGPLVAGVIGIRQKIHIRTVGATWCEGFVCETNLQVIVPLDSITFVSTQRECSCTLPTAKVCEHATLGSRLRLIERQGQRVAVTYSNGGMRGNVVAVWRDAIGVSNCDVVSVIPVSGLQFISIEGT